MEAYNLNNLLDNYTDSRTSDYVLFGNSQEFFEEYIYFCKPDFIALIDLKNEESILHSKNYNLNFDPLQEGTLEEIIEGVDKDQVTKIMDVDRSCLEFVDSNKLFGKSIMFQLRFTVTLIEGNPRTFLRKISFVKSKSSYYADPVLLVSIFDVTELVGIKKDPYVDIKYISKSKHKKKDKLKKNLSVFKKKMNNMLRDQIKLTKREKQILELISKGQTSDEISQKLFISVSTVNTHRQNLIKKFNVKNTSALIHMV